MKLPKISAPQIHHKRALDWINKLEATKTGTIKKDGIFKSDLPIEVDRSLRSFQISFNYKKQFYLHGDLDLGPFEGDLFLTIANQKYIANRVFFGTHSPPTFSGSIDQMYTDGHSELDRYFYRMIIPLERELRFHFSLQEQPFQSDIGYLSRTGTKCSISEDELFLSIFHDKEKNYFLSIDSQLPQNFELFTEKAFAARNALSFVSGYYAGDSCYCFAYSSKEMSEPKHLHFLSLPASMKSSFQPINTNPHSRLYYDRPLAEIWHDANCLRTLSIQEFSTLGEMIYKNQDFASAIILILESSVASLLFMPGGFAIALETIAPLIFTETKGSLAPISDKPFWKKIRREFLKVIDKFEESDADHNYKVLRSKINNLNAPTNKSKLRAPFDHLNIQLLAEDLAILETRNDFLHGRAPDLTNAGEGRTSERLNSDLFYSALRLSTLLSMLILKWIGYDNYVLNYPKINEVATGISLNEEPYRKV